MASATSTLTALITVLTLSVFSTASAPTHGDQDFLQCFTKRLSSPREVSDVVYLRNTTAYFDLLQSTIQNLRFNSSATPKPLAIIAPKRESEVQALVICCKQHGMQLRVRSGGHDYEGLSYISPSPFIVLDLLHFRSVEIDSANKRARVAAGATLGELYYEIGRSGRRLGFPAGLCPTMGVGGHVAGGGIGTMMRKHGLAADNVVDARVVVADGRVLERRTMGEDLFWAIRGGGGGSFGVVLEWTIKLVDVPPTVTVFTVRKTLQQGASRLLTRWQHIADKLHESLFIRVLLRAVNGTVQASFNSMFLGEITELLPLVQSSFPQLGLTAADCKQMSWIQSVLEFSGYTSDDDPAALLRKEAPYGKNSFKAKSDFAQKPIPETAFDGLWKLFLEEATVFKLMILDPLGGRLSEIPASATPFPFRKGYSFNIQYLVKWGNESEGRRALDLMQRLYGHMRPYVSKSPRGAYVNYRDLDLGINGEGNCTTYARARVWGEKYYGGNFGRLMQVKTVVDRDDFFRNEQSVPPLVCK